MKASELNDAVVQSRAQMDAMLTKKAWEDEDFRQRFVADPKGLIAEVLGRPLPDSLSVTVHEEAPGSLHFVIPAKPAVQAMEELADADLEQIAGGTSTWLAAAATVIVVTSASVASASASAISILGLGIGVTVTSASVIPSVSVIISAVVKKVDRR
jgi:hypothetical protein